LRPSQAPLATEEDLAHAHDPAYVRRFLAGEVTDVDMRVIGLPWTPALATYCRHVPTRHLPMACLQPAMGKQW
jgi:hypothetical protein